MSLPLAELKFMPLLMSAILSHQSYSHIPKRSQTLHCRLLSEKVMLKRIFLYTSLMQLTNIDMK